MGIFFVVTFFTIIMLQTLVSRTTSQKMVQVLVQSPNSPISTSANVSSSQQCTKNSDESYAVCASYNNYAVKYNLQPFSFAAKGPKQINTYSCDLYETSSQSTSRAVCVKGYSGTNAIVYFHRVSDMINVTNVTIGTTGNAPRAIVDTLNQVAYVSNSRSSPAIYKITNIGSSTPIFTGNLTSFGSGDDTPAATLIIDGFLFVHFFMTPARLARIDITTFTWNQTIVFQSGESGGVYDNLANDDNFIYDLTEGGILVRCTYKNNNFARFDSLITGLSNTNSLAISPDCPFLLFTAYYSGIILVNTSTFSVGSRTLLPNPASDGYDRARGRPIILSKNTSHPIYAFGFDFIFTFNISHVPFREKYPTIYPLPSSPINTSSGVVASLQCTKNSDESYAVCASKSNTAIKYNLQPFSFAAKGPNQGDYMRSCDLYETASQSTSRAVCIKGSPNTPYFDGVVYFHPVSDMTVITSVTIGVTGAYPHVFIDTPSQVAYVSNCYYDPVAIYKITDIGSATPMFAATLSSFGSDDSTPAAMLIIDGVLFVHFSMDPARLARIDISTFTWNQTVTFEDQEGYGYYDNLANDDNFIYDLTEGGILVRCTYKNNNFARFDSLITGLSATLSLTMMPDKKALFVACQGNSLLQMVDVASFSASGNSVLVPSAFGRPIIMSSGEVYAFSGAFDFVYAFRYTDTMNTRSSTLAVPSVSPPQTVTFSPRHQLALTSSHSLPMHSTSSLSLIQTATPDAKTEKTVRSLTHLNIKNKVAKTRTLSPQADRKNPFIQQISPPVASALVASDATQAIAVVSVAVLGSVSSSPVLGFNVGRQQAMTNFAKKSLEGDCRGLLPATTVNEFEEHISNPLGLGDSPTQMSIGGSEKLMSYYVGAVVGDFILTFGLVLLSQGIGMAVMKYFENKKNNNSNFGKMIRDRMGKKNNNKESTFEMMRRVFATSYVSLTLFFCLSFLLTPILSSSLIVLVAAMNDPKLKGHEVGVGLRILCIILAVIFCAVAVYFVVWSVFVRKQRKEKYRILKQETEPSVPAKFFKAEGEWCYPNPTSTSQQTLSNLMKNTRNNKNESNNQIQFNLAYHNFLISEPTFESYRDTIWFCCVEIISAILLAFPPFFAQFSSSAKGSCLVQGIMLLIIILIYTILLIWKNPFKTRVNRVMNPILAVQQLAIVLISLIIVATRSDNDDGESPSWLWKILIVPLGFQGAMSFLMIGAAFFPFVMFLKKLKGRMSRNQGQSEHRDRDLRGRNSSRSTGHRENSVEMLPKVKNEKSSSSKRDHPENNHRADGDRRNNKHRNSRENDNANLPSAIPCSSNKNNNNDDNCRRTNESSKRHRRNNSSEREHRRSSRNNNNNNCSTEQRERERCARTLNISSSSLSPRRPLSNGPCPDRVENELLRRPNQFRDKTTQSNTSRR